MITSGRDIPNSKPSRRIFSAKIVICNSPRPETLNLPSPTVSKFIATLVCISDSSRSFILFDVTCLPSCPARGESFTENTTLKVGSSICIGSKGIGFTGSQILSPTSTVSIPANATISPASASSISILFKPRKPISLVIRPFTISPLAFAKAILLPFLIVPLKMREIPIFPT